MKYFYLLVIIAVVVQSSPGNGSAAPPRGFRLQRTFQPILDAVANFTILCSSSSSSLRVNDSMPILFGLINQTSPAKFESNTNCLNSTQMNLETTESIEVIRDKLDDLFKMERQNNTDPKKKKFIINIIGQAIYLARTLNDSQLISELQNASSFNSVVNNWLNAKKDIINEINTTCSNETLDLGQMFPSIPNMPDWGTWPPNTCVNFDNLRNATHAALDLINCKLQGLYSEETDKLHPYQKAFSIAVVLEIDVWGSWLSQVGFNPGQLWKRNTPPQPDSTSANENEQAQSTHQFTTHSGSTHSGSTHLSSTHSGSTHSDSTHSGSTHSGSTHSDSTHSGSTHSDSTHSGSTHSGSTHSGSTHLSSTHSGSTHSDTTHSGSTHSGSTHSGSTHSGSTHSDSTHSGSTHSSSHASSAHY